MSKGKGATGNVTASGSVNANANGHSIQATYQPKSDGSGVRWNGPSGGGHETTRQVGSVVDHHHTNHQTGVTHGFKYNRATGEGHTYTNAGKSKK
jgi:hypothetical protein